MPTRRTSKEEEDDDIKEEEDCTAAASAAATAATTTAATAGCHASSAATASNQAVAAVVAAWHSGLRRVAITAEADTCYLCVFLVNVHYAWHGTPCHGSFPPEFRPEFRIPLDSRTKLILSWNDLIPTCVPRNQQNSAEFRRFRKMRPVRNRNKKRNAHPR